MPSISVENIKKFATLYAARIAGSGATFLLIAQIAIYLDLQALGQFAIYVALTNFYAAVASGGFSHVGVLFASEYQSKSDWRKLSGFIRTAYHRIAQISVLVSLTVLLLYLSFGHTLTSVHIAIGIGAFISGTAVSMMNFNGSVMIGLGRQLRGLVCDAFVRPVLTLAMWGSASLMLPAASITISTIIAISTIAAVLSALGSRFVTSKIHEIADLHGTEYQQKRWNRAALAWIPQSLLSDYYIDIFMLACALMLEAPQLAILHVCFRLRAIAGFGLRSIYMIHLPKIGTARNTSDHQTIHRLLGHCNQNATVFSALTLAFFSLFGHQILGWFNIVGVENYLSLLIIMAVLLLKSSLGPSAFVLSMHDKHIGSVTIAFIGALIGMSAAFLLAPHYPIIGSAAAYTISLSATGLLGWGYCLQKAGINTLLRTVRIPGGKSGLKAS